ncbi:9025_t:CDS:2 [Funneliformis caledonium]|uniref:9025_t:CDS:1 n=1 Tax=Funneliformis caledonium TaxID=1117310 RepID=A0A9N9C0Q9_9GLOM|nr:9025_t:CDS:2 [Funneliformis caledonium]
MVLPDETLDDGVAASDISIEKFLYGSVDKDRNPSPPEFVSLSEVELGSQSEVEYGSKRVNRFHCQHPGCSKTFRDNFQLETHVRTHTGEKPFACDYQTCNKRFAQKANLTTHQKTHSGVKPYVCEICKQKFTQLSQVNAHIKVHTGEKNYECEICNKKFSEKGQLKAHKDTKKHKECEFEFQQYN